MSPTRIILILILSAVTVYGMVRLANPVEVIEIAIQDDGTLVFDGQNIEIEQVFPRVQAALLKDSQTVIYIRAKAKMPAGQVVLVVQEVERAGAEPKIGEY